MRPARKRTAADALSHATPDAPTRSVVPHPRLDVLPLDVLGLILDFIPRCPRLRSVSRVSKRWRSAVMRTITHAQLRPDTMQEMLALLPCLTSAEVSWDQQPSTLALPTRLRRLSFFHVGSGVLDVVSSIPPLEDLVFRQHGHGNLLRACIGASLTSLTSLTLEHSMYTSHLWLTTLATTPRMPALTLLRLSACHASNEVLERIADFLELHCSQLTSLTLRPPPGGDEATRARLAAITYPALRTLTLGAFMSVTHFAQFIRNASQLTQLSVTLQHARHLHRLLHSHVQSLTALELPPQSGIKFLPRPVLAWLATLPSLQSLDSLLQIDADFDPAHAVFVPRIRRLRIKDTRVCPEALTTAVNVASLFLCVPLLYAPPLLPHLKTIWVVTESCNPTLLLDTLRNLLPSAPRLSTLYLPLDAWSEEAGELLMCASLRHHLTVRPTHKERGSYAVEAAALQRVYSHGWLTIADDEDAE